MQRKRKTREKERKTLPSRLSPVHGVKGGVRDRYTLLEKKIAKNDEKREKKREIEKIYRLESENVYKLDSNELETT